MSRLYVMAKKRDLPEAYRCVMSTTHVDRHGDRMIIGALKSGAKQINSPRKPKLTINHDQALPPSGVITNAYVEKRADGFHQLVATQRFYNKQRLVKMPDGSPGLLEYFDDISFVFSEVDYKEFDGYELSVDVHCFESRQDADDFITSVRRDSPIEFKVGHFARKSFLNDPQLIFTLGSKAVHALLDNPYKPAAIAAGGIVAKKVLEKVGDRMGDDLSGVYTWLSKSMVAGVKWMHPKNRMVTYILQVPGAINLELIVRTNDVAIAIEATGADKFAQGKGVIDSVLQGYNPAKLSLLYNVETKLWEFNFMLSRDGQTLSSLKAIVARNKAYVDLGELMNAKATDSLKIEEGSIPTEIAVNESIPLTTTTLPS
jgi:hypothetical protein